MISKLTLIAAITGVAPHLIPYFNSVLAKPEYTITELNVIFKGQLIVMGISTPELCSCLCESTDTTLWIYYFCQNIVPAISNSLAVQYVSHDNFMRLMAG